MALAVGDGVLRVVTGGEQTASLTDLEVSLGSSFQISVDSYKYAPFLFVDVSTISFGDGVFEFELLELFETFGISSESDFRGRGDLDRRLLGESV